MTRVRNAMFLADARGTGWLFELLPDLFPGGYLTDIEMQVWDLYYQEKKERR